MQSKTITTDKNNREEFKNKLFNKVEAVLTPPVAEPVVESEPIDIVDKYATWVPARFALDQDEVLPVNKKDEPLVLQREEAKREAIKLDISAKVETSLASPMVEVPSEPEIIEKYANWVSARAAIAPDDGLPPEFKEIETSISPWEAEKRATIEASTISKTVEPPVRVKPVVKPVEIIEKYAKGTLPRPLPDEAFFPETIREENSSRDFNPHSELEKRTSVKSKLFSKVEEAVVLPPAPQEELPIEIIEKYSSWVPARVAIDPVDEFTPEFKNQEPVLSPFEAEKREAVLNKVDPLPVPVQNTPEPEIIEKYSAWVPARIALDLEDELIPEAEARVPFNPYSEQEKRAAIKKGMLNKIEEALTPPAVPVEVEPAPIEIVDKYATWVPARVAMEILEEELLPEFKVVEPILSPYEIEKRDAVNQSILDREIATIIPPAVQIEVEPEIIEKYSTWVPARVAIETEDALLPEFKTQEPILSPYEEEKRDTVNRRSLDKIAEVPTASQVEVEPEIIDKYSTWAPARLSIEPEDELLPEFKKEALVVTPREAEKRVSIKKGILDKIEEALIPPVAPIVKEPEPIEIVEKHSTWVPAFLAMQSEELLPEFKKDKPIITAREVEKRQSIKQGILGKIEQSLTPPMVEVEPEIEIIDKYSKGLPQHFSEAAEPIFPDARRILNPISRDLDVPKRLAFKNKLLNKLNSIPEPQTIAPIEVVEYTDRVVNSYGFDYPELKNPITPEPIIDLQNSIVDFQPVIDEAPVPVLLLPDNYGDMDERALYGILIRDAELKHTSETANLALDVLAGRSSTKVEFTVVNKPKPINTPKVKKVLEIPVIIEAAAEGKPIGAIEHSVYVDVQPEMIDFDLPADWKFIPLSTLRTDLLSTGATPEQVDAKMASLVKIDDVAELVLDVSVCPIGQLSTKPDAAQATMVEELPEGFKTWKPNSQYIYLTKELKLTPEKANDLVFNSVKE